jgi:hypothetical protein
MLLTTHSKRLSSVLSTCLRTAVHGTSTKYEYCSTGMAHAQWQRSAQMRPSGHPASKNQGASHAFERSTAAAAAAAGPLAAAWLAEDTSGAPAAAEATR